jgi:hypothetical protein
MDGDAPPDWYATPADLQERGRRRLWAARRFDARILLICATVLLLLGGAGWWIQASPVPGWAKVALAVAALLALGPPLTFVAVYCEGLRDESKAHAQQGRHLLRMSRAARPRTWVLEQPFVLLLREFAPAVDYSLAQVFRRKQRPVEDEAWLWFSPLDKLRHGGERLAAALGEIPLLVVSLLNVDSPMLVPEWVCFLPAAPDRWQDAVRECLARARGTIVVAREITESITVELALAERLPPERVLILLDVDDLMGAHLRGWPERCPAGLRSRAVALGSPGLERAVRGWVAALDDPGERKRPRPG